jgi:hypothetical protein
MQQRANNATHFSRGGGLPTETGLICRHNSPLYPWQQMARMLQHI